MVELAELNNTDTESIANKSILSEIRSVADPETDPETDSSDTVEKYFEQIDQPSRAMDNFGVPGATSDQDNEIQQSQSILTGNPGAFGNNQMNNQNFSDPNYMPMNMPSQHMQHMINMAPHMQPPPQPMFVQLKLSDDDILRIAQKVQELMSKDIEKVVEKKVALEVASLQKEMDKLTKTLAKVQKELKEVKIHNDDLEQYSRRSCLRISGIAENEPEDTTKIVLDLAARCGANIRMDDIDRSHRVGRPNTQTIGDDDMTDMTEGTREPTRAREIIVKFRTHGARLQLLKGRAFFRDRNENIFINEDLTKTRKNLAYTCRKLKKDLHSSIVKTWVYNGNVYIQDSDENKVLVSCSDDLDPYKQSNETATDRR